MGKKARLGVLLLFAALCALLMGGCADYRGLDELTVVAGMAVDIDEDNPGQLQVLFEILDLYSTNTNEDQASKILISRGRSVAEAVYKANEKLHDNLYFGNCEILVVSTEVARTVGLDKLMDSMLRDSEIRDNLRVLISGEETAGEIITPPEDHGGIISFDLSQNIDMEKNSANSTRSLELYEIYNALALGTINLQLPMIRFSDDDDDDFLFDGMAIFEGDKLVSFLDREYMSYYQLATSKLSSGGYYIDVERQGEEGLYASVASRHSKPGRSFRYEDGQFTFTVEIYMSVDAIEFSPGWSGLRGEDIRQLEDDISAYLGGHIKTMALTYATEGIDLFDFGDNVRNHNYRVWTEVEQDWKDKLQDARFEVVCDVKVNNTGLMEEFYGNDTISKFK